MLSTILYDFWYFYENVIYYFGCKYHTEELKFGVNKWERQTDTERLEPLNADNKKTPHKFVCFNLKQL